MQPQCVTIAGAGLAGSLLAVTLARRGFHVTVYERRADPRKTAAERGRSINLALAARGVRALSRCGVMPEVLPLLVAMRGRMVHEPGGDVALHLYGQRDDEVIHSVSRGALNVVLMEAAEREGVKLHFGQACLGGDADGKRLRVRDEGSGREYAVPLAPTIATDGAGSAVRTSLAESGLAQVREARLEHDYKELTLPAVAGRHALEPNSLHIWPRRGFMVIALPNLDGSFTVTLFLGREGSDSFATLTTRAAVQRFFSQHFADLVPLMPNLLDDFERHPQGQLGTVHVSRWHVGASVLLLGDAAHAIVPFHGQGMNAAFEDCAALDELLDRHDDWGTLFAEFEAVRRPNAAAIAQMALENYVEMRDTVLDPKFRRLKVIADALERRFPGRFAPRYAMVTFHAEIPYSEALRRGAVQAEVLDQLDSRRTASGDIDWSLAHELVCQRLQPWIQSVAAAR
jgi:kynurenine 3-monooxygenase